MVDAFVKDLANGAEWAHDVEFFDIDGDLGALHARVTHVSNHAQLVLNQHWVYILVASSCVERHHGWGEKYGEDEEDKDERPQDVCVCNDTEAKPGKRLSLELSLVLDVVLLLFLGFLFHFLAVHHHCGLFLEQRF